ncbi:ATP-binding cassette domain-containing protein [Salibacterium halotolerans]|uniref:ABC-2 type transport system ATP-binding protein n=1 Tax=Salibacterium halotolerans TaxID=1884432 RepID=A0A1I5XZ46_9BACI|nr:ABC transporter ATP-binding protein [Salibacterium halotolerans]SFQ37186.1 ABC-2 type transport system ATP-binding protein [Salibacterium halotolerans]
MTFDVLFKNVSLTYKKTKALQDVSFHLERGKVYGLIGRNGAGKTSLLSLLASFRQPTSGTVQINGVIPFDNPRIMPYVSYIFDKDFKDDRDEAQQLIERTARFRPHFDKAYARHLAERFQLPLDMPVQQLSKGMQSALQVILGLAARSPVTIFDEAYTGMDAPAREIFYEEVLEDQARSPRTMILSTHLVSEMDYLFDEVLMIHEGRLLLHETNDEPMKWGAWITGGTNQVEAFTQDLTQLHVRRLGGTTSVMVHGELSEEKQRQAQEQGLDIAPLSLQDLFIHVTKEENNGEKHSMEADR